MLMPCENRVSDSEWRLRLQTVDRTGHSRDPFDFKQTNSLADFQIVAFTHNKLFSLNRGAPAARSQHSPTETTTPQGRSLGN